MRFYEFGKKSAPAILLFPGTTVHCFFATKMGEEYLRRYQKHFADPVIHRFDMEHEELLVLYPEKWVKEVKEVCL